MRLNTSPVAVTAAAVLALIFLNPFAPKPSGPVGQTPTGDVTVAPNLGAPDQGQVQVPTNYNAWAPPARGQYFTDAAYGTRLRRLSDGSKVNKGQGVHHEYSNISPFNLDGTRVLLIEELGGTYLADLAGNTVIAPAELALGPRPEPRWSLSDPHIFYYHEQNVLYRYDIRARQKTVLKTFSEYEYITFGSNEADLSVDGDYLLFGAYGRPKQVIGVYRISTNAVGPLLDVTSLGSVVTTDFTPSGNVALRWAAQGTGRYKGFELFDKNMNFIRQIYPYGATADWGRASGDDVFVFTASNDPQPAAGCENDGVQTLNLRTGVKSCLLPLFFGSDVSLSVNEFGSTARVLVTIADLNGTAKPSAELPSDWQTKWRPRANEILLVNLDGSEKQRLAHHRSRSFFDYWWKPRASLSRDGRFVVFDSNFGTQPLKDYTDVFLINLAGAPIFTALSSVSAASFKGDTVLASDTITAAFGVGLAAAPLAATTTPLPTTLGGTTVTVRDSTGTQRLAPLFFVAPGQVNYLIPAGTANGNATVTIGYGEDQAVGTVKIENTAAGVFSANANGQGVVAGYVLRVRNGGQTVESLSRLNSTTRKYESVPIDLGPAGDAVYLVLSATGLRNRPALNAVTAKIGGTDAQVAFAGAQGTRLAGLDQINLLLPRTLAGRGEVDIALTVEGKPANLVRVNIR